MNIKARMFDSVGDSFLVNAAAEITQFGLFILLGIVVFPIFFKGINPAFGLMLPAGFVGGMERQQLSAVFW